jgi:plasmid stabilization system protein ParE
LARGSKKSYTGKQKRKAEKIAKSYKKRGVSAKEAKARAWATTNKEGGGGKKSGSGRGRKTTKTAARKGGRKGGKKAAAKRKK